MERTTVPRFEVLARELSPALLRYLGRMVGDEATAADLVQETLVRIAARLHTFDGRCALKTWAFAIATHAALDHLRQPGRRLRILDIAEAGEVADDGPPIEERLVVDEMNHCVREVIDALPADYRAALVLHELEGLTAEETARACGCSLATAKIRIHRGRERLRGALQRECDFYRDGGNVLRCDRKR